MATSANMPATRCFKRIFLAVLLITEFRLVDFVLARVSDVAVRLSSGGGSRELGVEDRMASISDMNPVR